MRPPVLVLPLLLIPALASASEGESAVSVLAGYGHFGVSQDQGSGDELLTARGGVLGLDYERGIGDAFWLRASAVGGLYDGPDGLTGSGTLTGGITYQFDVLRYVPYIHLGAGAFLVGGGGIERDVKPLVELGLGLEVLESRSFSWGAEVTFDSFGADVLYLVIGPRVSWRWGYF